MILISRTSTGLLIQRDAAEIAIDASAVPLALPAIIATLIDSGRACGQARREGYEMGLTDGRERQRIEAETHARIETRAQAELSELLCDAYTPLAA